MKNAINKSFILILLSILLTGCVIVLPPKESELNNINADPYFLYMGDPYILVYDSKYYLYGTTSNNGFQVFESEDLESWSQPVGYKDGFALRKEDVWGDSWFWAPEVYYLDDQFYMFFTVEEHIAVAVANSPIGPFMQTEQNVLLTRNAIDSHVFIDDDGTKYIYYVLYNEGNEIWCALLNDDSLSIIPGTEQKCLSVSQDWEKSETPPTSTVNEGPFILKHNGYYYLTYSANSYASRDYGIGYAISTSPLGPWTKHPENPLLQNNGDLVGIGHNAVFIDENGKLMIVYHAHNNWLFVNPRKVYINYLEFYTDPDYSYDILKIGNIVSYALHY